MKKKHKGFKIFVMVIIGAGILALVTWVVMLLWNWLIPYVFAGGPEITYWQALGILVLSKILFGGFRHYHPAAFRSDSKESWKQKLKEKWNCMDEEKKAKIRNNMFARFYNGDEYKKPAGETGE